MADITKQTSITQARPRTQSTQEFTYPYPTLLIQAIKYSNTPCAMGTPADLSQSIYISNLTYLPDNSNSL